VVYSTCRSTLCKKPSAQFAKETTLDQPKLIKWVNELTYHKSRQNKSPAICWSMLVSHHPPCDYDRTIIIAGVHVCTRCAGMFFGAVIGMISCQYLLHAPATILIGAGVLFALPAGIDFTMHEISRQYQSNNFRRLSTGFLFGVVAAMLFGCTIFGRLYPFLVFCVAMIIMQFTIATIFRVTGHLDSYIDRYINGTRKDVRTSPIDHTPKG